MRAFWPPVEAAQADYEMLRTAVLAGAPLADAVAARFARAGLVALIARPVAEPVFVAVVNGARRPGWTPYDDPRIEALVGSFVLLLASADTEWAPDQQRRPAGAEGG